MRSTPVLAISLLLSFLAAPAPALLGCARADAAPGAAGTAAPAAPPAGAAADREAIRATVELYLQGHRTGDGAYFRRAFHPDWRMQWVKDGAVTQRTAAEYIGGASGKPADDEARRARRILLVDVDGDAAIAKVELDYPAARIVDYLALLKVEGTWLVVNKTFSVRAAAAAAAAAAGKPAAPAAPPRLR